MVPVVLGLSLPGVYGLIMQAFSSSFTSGTATALDMANKLMQAPLGIFGQSLAIAVFPALTQFFAQQRMDAFRTQLASTLRTVVFITLPISVIFVMLAPEIVTLLFQYGSKFQSSDSQAVGSALRMFGFGVIFWCLHPVLMRAFFSIQNSVTPIALGSATTLLFVALCFGLQGTGIGYLALPLASSIGAAVLAVAMLATIRTKIGGLDLAGLGQTFGKSFVAGLAMALLLGLGQLALPTGIGQANAMALVKVFGFGLIAAWAYIWLCMRMGMPETAYVERALARLDRKRNS